MVCRLGSAEGVREPSGVTPSTFLKMSRLFTQQLFLLLAALHEEGLLVQVAVVAHLVAAASAMSSQSAG